ncbi:hypothetical protein F4813DRAFT_386513 [Daldinia decipiens]|uniref:uncharacterized protein n=1 Tax=Daldinia decipiens TaxID=326647 RepID=UPI0020C44457|nr:uncharacterized protein F4813DRAFT_386513 [Daldinia decipiens]KAI1660310.1 hypothetical protein F4813DRAFT_386513 [Daldinia decipiens]
MTRQIPTTAVSSRLQSVPIAGVMRALGACVQATVVSSSLSGELLGVLNVTTITDVSSAHVRYATMDPSSFRHLQANMIYRFLYASKPREVYVG